MLRVYTSSFIESEKLANYFLQFHTKLENLRESLFWYIGRHEEIANEDSKRKKQCVKTKFNMALCAQRSIGIVVCALFAIFLESYGWWFVYIFSICGSSCPRQFVELESSRSLCRGVFFSFMGALAWTLGEMVGCGCSCTLDRVCLFVGSVLADCSTI